MSEASMNKENRAHALNEPPTFKCFEKNKTWRFRCPACKKEHQHGIGPGHRVAHCIKGPFRKTGYFLVLDEKGDEMSDLVQRLLNAGNLAESWLLCDEAAERIKELESALREIINKDSFSMDWAIKTARKALEGKDD